MEKEKIPCSISPRALACPDFTWIGQRKPLPLRHWFDDQAAPLAIARN
jgi:hypothetical protein